MQALARDAVRLMMKGEVHIKKRPGDDAGQLGASQGHQSIGREDRRARGKNMQK